MKNSVGFWLQSAISKLWVGICLLSMVKSWQKVMTKHEPQTHTFSKKTFLNFKKKSHLEKVDLSQPDETNTSQLNEAWLQFWPKNTRTLAKQILSKQILQPEETNIFQLNEAWLRLWPPLTHLLTIKPPCKNKQSSHSAKKQTIKPPCKGFGGNFKMGKVYIITPLLAKYTKLEV